MALIVLFGSLLFTGTSTALPLDAFGICLLFSGLYWWALLTKHVMRRRQRERQAKLLSVLGLFGAFAVIVGTHPSMRVDLPALILTFALTLWCWRQALARVMTDSRETGVLASLKLGFFVLLSVLLLALLLTDSRYSLLLALLVSAFPLFFFCSLATLALLRLNVIKREYRDPSHAGTSANPTRIGLLQFALLTGGLLVFALLLIFAFQPLRTALLPLWNVLETLFSWLIALLNAFFGHQHPKIIIKHTFKKTLSHPVIPQPYHNPLLVTLLVIGSVALLLLLIIVILRQWPVGHKTDEDEERQHLSLRSLLKARWHQWQRHPKAVGLEPLQPQSARARYRQFLQAMARRNDHLHHREHETPCEYQARLAQSMQEVSVETRRREAKEHAPADAVILHELTSAYILERYGGRQTDSDTQAYLALWVPYFVKRLLGSVPRKIR